MGPILLEPCTPAGAPPQAAHPALTPLHRSLLCRCAHVEGLIACQRYREAAAECEGLLEGPDRLYLQAEVAWRTGELEGALGLLGQALAAAPACAKAAELRGFVARLEGLWREADLAREDGALTHCLELSGRLLGAAAPRACVGLACAVRQLRAEACGAAGLWAEARAELDAALALDAAHAKCLQLRAEAHRHLGCYLDCMLDLQRLQKAAPGTPGLFALMEQAARLALGARQQQRGRQGATGGSGDSGGGAWAAGAGGGGAADALQELGLGPTATAAQVRQAYLRLAAKWHPDKWAASGEGECAEAEARFKVIQRAYEALAG